MHLGLISRDLRATENWARQQGWTVVESLGRMVRVDAPHEAIARVLGLVWDILDQGRWHASGTPALPAHVLHVSGLSNLGRLGHYHRLPRADISPGMAIPPVTTNGPRPGYTPSQINAAYGIDQPWDGTGETIGIAEWGSDFSQEDFTLFCNTFQLPVLAPAVVNLAGYTPSGTVGVEADLDVQWAHAMAPGAGMTVYQASPGTDYASFALEVSALFNAVLAEPNPPHVLSVSYGNGESSFLAEDLHAWEILLTDLGNRGVTVVVASGDQGAYGLHEIVWPQAANVAAPASCPHAMAVGGTSLFMDLLHRLDEWGWSNLLEDGASGGGVSQAFPAPFYQPGRSGRTVPDLAAVADPFTPCILAWQGQWALVGGTSLAAPIVAGLLTRINHARRLARFDPLGYITPVLYDLQSRGIPLCRDIPQGTNTCYAVAGYDSAAGYDYVTGWGTPVAQNWFDQLAWGAPKP
ncbi:MAG: S53 family peptidase [Sulfobacillus sp.]